MMTHPTPTDQALASAHSLPQRLTLALKVTLLSWRRHLYNRLEGVRAHPLKPLSPLNEKGALLAEQKSALWGEGAPWGEAPLPLGERALTAGKIENLRVAARALHGAHIPALSTFSFWAHVGAPTRRRGFVIGRELQQGCVLPSVAGGICQLSNALYQAALSAGLEVIERHSHSLLPPELKGQDATLKWPYLDLRLRAPFAWRIEARLEGDELIVRLFAQLNTLPASEAEAQAQAQPPKSASHSSSLPISGARSCYSCDVTSCHQHKRHRGAREALRRHEGARYTLLLGASWPEHEQLLVKRAAELTLATLITPAAAWAPRLGARYGWSKLQEALKSAGELTTRSCLMSTVRRALALRASARRGENAFEALLREDERLTTQLAAHIPHLTTHLIVSQELLPALERRGELAGRWVEVLQSRPSLEALHAPLDELAQLHPEALTLRDFRAPAELVSLERRALQGARRLFTPHPRFLTAHQSAAWAAKVQELSWVMPKVSLASAPPLAAPLSKRRVILLCGSLTARKGRHALEALWRHEQEGLLRGYELAVLPGQEDEPALREALGARLFKGVWSEVACALDLSPIPHAPRLALRALALGLPVVMLDDADLEGEAVYVVTSAQEGEAQDELTSRLTATLTRALNAQRELVC